jgi:very-short-patch-repair endonuclease
VGCSGRRSRPSTTGAIPASRRTAPGSARRTAPSTAASRSRLYDPEAIRDALTRRPPKALKDLLTEATVTQSTMKDRFLTLCARHRVPQPHTQYRVGAKRYDFAWPQQRVVVETDSWPAHANQVAFQADRSQTNALQLAGWLVLRFTWADLTRRSRETAAAVRRSLTR